MYEKQKLKHMLKCRKNDLVIKKIPFQKFRNLLPQMGEFAKRQENYMIQDSDQLEKMLRGFQEYYDKQEKVKVDWGQKVKARYQDKIHDETDIQELISIEADHRALASQRDRERVQVIDTEIQRKKEEF